MDDDSGDMISPQIQAGEDAGTTTLELRNAELTNDTGSQLLLRLQTAV